MDEPIDDVIAAGAPSPVASGMSGDPLLKRLVDLAHLGWTARLVLFSNGQLVSGVLISPAQFRSALAATIRSDDPGGFDSLVASVVDAEDPPIPDAALGLPEPRFIHLADVRLGPAGDPIAPFMRIRLPAVSGFWIAQGGAGNEEG